MPPWLLMVAGGVLVWWPLTFVAGLLGTGIWLLFVSMVLAVLAVPALVVLLVHADRLGGHSAPVAPTCSRVAVGVRRGVAPLEADLVDPEASEVGHEEVGVEGDPA